MTLLRKRYIHNDYIFKRDGDEVVLIRDFEGMYRNCEDPHGQSMEMDNLSYHLVGTVLDRAVSILQRSTAAPLAIIDIGCGLGYFTAHLKHRFPFAHVCGVDISVAALQRAKCMAPACRFEHVDVKSPDLRVEGGKRYHLAIAMDTLYYFKDDEIAGVMNNVRGLIADHGYLMVGYHLPQEMRFGRYIQSLEDAKRMISRHNFELVYSFDVHNMLDKSYDGQCLGRHLYFLARKIGSDD